MDLGDKFDVFSESCVGEIAVTKILRSTIQGSFFLVEFMITHVIGLNFINYDAKD